MLKIKLLQGIGGHRTNGSIFSYQPGTVVEWPAAEAKRFIDAGYAELVRDDKAK